MNQPSEIYRVRVTKDELVFSAAHFITFNGNICERLHGHNWRAAVEVVGVLDENHYVFDFIALRDATRQIIGELDHRVLLPTLHRTIRIQESGHEIEATFENRRWLFPREDCVLLPVENTTAELLARWVGMRLLAALPQSATRGLTKLSVEIEENFGQWAVCELRLN